MRPAPSPWRSLPAGSRPTPRCGGQGREHGQDQYRAGSDHEAVHLQARIGFGQPGRSDRQERRDGNGGQRSDSGGDHAGHGGHQDTRQPQLAPGHADGAQRGVVASLDATLTGQELPDDHSGRQGHERAEEQEGLGLEMNAPLDVDSLRRLLAADQGAPVGPDGRRTPQRPR